MGDIKPIAKILAEVDESRIKIIYSTRWNKAQSLLADKLRKQSQHQRETCEHVRSANLKLQSEIVEAERNINSMWLAQQSMNMANVELKKELKLTKEKKSDFLKKIETCEKKYDLMWIESKKRYESLQHVQKLIIANKNLDNTKRNIVELDELSLKLVDEIDAKTKNCADINKKRTIELAVFIVRDIPEYHKIIDEKTKAIAELAEKIREFETKLTRNAVTDEKNEANSKTAADSEWPTFKADDIMIMPTLELSVRDVDALSLQLVNSKNTKTENLNDEAKEAFPKTRFEINMFQSNNKDDLISSYFPKLMNHEQNETENYSKRKLIHILQDVKINNHDALKMISKAKRVSLEPVEAVGAKIINSEMIQNSPRPSLDNKSKEPIQSEEIEEIDLTSKSENILNPPSEFLDVTTITITTEDNFEEVVAEEEEANNVKESLEAQSLSQQKDVASATKRVSFNLSSNLKSNEAVGGIEENATYELNVSAASDDGYANIKDMVMKQHNLDLSPQFVYAKNTKLQKNTENSIVTSKFFQQNDNNMNTDIAETEPVKNKEPDEKPLVNASPEENQLQESGQGIKNIEFDVCDDAVTSPVKHKATDEPQSLKPVSGFIFNHGAHGISDSLDLSFSTNGYEDGDDFPQCIDSNILLSPKANLPSPCGSNTEVSQEVPNFISGLRKTGMSIFRFLPTLESKPDSNTAQNAGTSSGFSFNFGGKDEKKARGGLFSMFQ